MKKAFEKPLPSRRLTQFRLESGLSQEQVARAAEPPTTNQQIGKLENGVGPHGRELTFEWAKRLAPVFDKYAEDFFVEGEASQKSEKPALNANDPLSLSSYGHGTTGEDRCMNNDERKLLQVFRLVDAHRKSRLLGFVDDLMAGWKAENPSFRGRQAK